MNIQSKKQQTLLFVHAHPDDEALLTAGTMARASAEGHRVILLVATNGAAGLTSDKFKKSLSSVRQTELQQSAKILGVHKVISWEFPDSGLRAEEYDGFAHMDLDHLSDALAQVCLNEEVDILVGYDPSGGYGHPDHLQIHRVVRHTQRQLGNRCIYFDATLPREPIATSVRVAARLGLTPSGFNSQEFEQAWTTSENITHRVNVRPFLSQKRRAIAAHASQAHADGTVRTLAVLSRLPRPLFAALMGTEYFVKVG